MASEERTSERNHWRFDFSASRVLTGAQHCLSYHGGRLEYWLGEIDNVNAKIKESGVEIRERSFTGGAEFEAVVDQELAKRKQHCQRRIDYHRAQMVAYKSWIAALGSEEGPRRLGLTVEDVQFFRLGELD